MPHSNLSHENFNRLTKQFPALQGKLRNAETTFIPFDTKIADQICSSSYVIPFVSETDCLITRRENGKWVLPGGTVEPGENWMEAGKREILEETGSIIESLCPIGMYHCISQASHPIKPHVPHPESVRIVSWANVNQVQQPSDPDLNSKIVEVRVIHFKEARSLFGSAASDFGALYESAYHARQIRQS